MNKSDRGAAFTEYKIEAELSRSETYGDSRISPGARSAARHRMVEWASKEGTIQAWVKVGEALISANARRDLTPQVSDHFLRECPDNAFTLVARAARASRHDIRFRWWVTRAAGLLD